MTSESSQLAAALPVRRRETLEIFDTALKLYRRYFWVLLGWSALVSVMAFVPILSFFALFTTPLLHGAVSCCVAGAVRGQKVTFAQTWAFTKPRYGPMLGTMLLAWLIFSAIIIAFYIAAALIIFAGVLALANAPQTVQVVTAIVGYLAILVVFSALGVVAFGWLNMVPIVACLEDDKRGTAAMGRAFELLKGHWRRVFGMSLIIGLAALALFGIVGGAYSLLAAAQWSEIFSSSPSESAIWGLLLTFGAFTGLFMLIWNPAQSLIIAVLYLDLRVRREALDLEWTAYASAPPIPVDAPATQTPVSGELNPYLASAGAPLNPASQPNVAPASFSAGSEGTNFAASADERGYREVIENVAVENSAVENVAVENAPVENIAAENVTPAPFQAQPENPEPFEIKPIENGTQTLPPSGIDEPQERKEA